MKLTCLLSLALFCLAGCADQKARMAGGDQSFARLPGFLPLESTAQAPASAGASGAGSAKADVERIQQDLAASNNQTQQTLAGVGLQMGKLAEKVQGFGGDLAHVDAKVTGVEKAVASLDVKIDQRFEASANVQAKALSDWQLQFENRLDARLNAQTAGVAALKSDLQQMSQTVSSGRDSVVETVQFSREFRDTLLKAFDTVLDLVKAFTVMMVGLWLALQITDRMRNRNDHQELMKALGLLAGQKKEEKHS